MDIERTNKFIRVKIWLKIKILILTCATVYSHMVILIHKQLKLLEFGSYNKDN